MCTHDSTKPGDLTRAPPTWRVVPGKKDPSLYKSWVSGRRKNAARRMSAPKSVALLRGLRFERRGKLRVDAGRLRRSDKSLDDDEAAKLEQRRDLGDGRGPRDGAVLNGDGHGEGGLAWVVVGRG